MSRQVDQDVWVDRLQATQAKARSESSEDYFSELQGPVFLPEDIQSTSGWEEVLMGPLLFPAPFPKHRFKPCRILFGPLVL